MCALIPMAFLLPSISKIISCLATDIFVKQNDYERYKQVRHLKCSQIAFSQQLNAMHNL